MHSGGHWKLSMSFNFDASVRSSLVDTYVDALEKNWSRSVANSGHHYKKRDILSIKDKGLFGNLFSFHFISIFRLGCCLCPIQWVWQHQSTSYSSFPCVIILRVNAKQATFADSILHTFGTTFVLGFPRPLVLIVAKSEPDLIQDVACSIFSDRLSHWLWRTIVVSSM